MRNRADIDRMGNLDNLHPDPYDPNKNQNAIDKVVGMEIIKTIAVWDEFVHYFDAVEDMNPENKEKSQVTETKRDKMDKFEDFLPSQAISAMENMRGTLFFRIQGMQRQL